LISFISMWKNILKTWVKTYQSQNYNIRPNKTKSICIVYD